ncbi:UDP-glycosyltransferase UGT5-like [Tribolium madens]|uniref:UDP-glycosyltransferase UGT5-like n=1 Tax=Tribolium madens TaxID=41895 RepID=UPI001CF759D1|nr:UDP-glycosyltransferase UGT5-like [Tribolium madens]
MKNYVVFVFVLAIIFINETQTSEILVVAPMPSYSHFSIPFKLSKELAKRGHKVTCINPYPQKAPIKNYVDISVTENIEVMEEIRKQLFDMNKFGVIENLTFIFDMIKLLVDRTMTNKNVQDLLKSDKKFDVVIIEDFLNEAMFGLGYHYKAPVILISATTTSDMSNYIFANPAPASYVPGMGGTLTKCMNFWQRIENVLTKSVFYGLLHLYHLPQQRELFHKYISNDTDLDSIIYNTSLMLTNSHVSVSDAVPHVPSIIEIGGFHVNPPKKLPEDLQKFLDNATEGFILFSMGSNLKSDDLKPEVRDGILKAFSKIKEKVLWKFENDLPNLPSNVKIMKWIPQQDVLAHPNIRAFISHGGFLSTVEAVYHGVPIVGIPVFGDQKYNIATAEQDGYAIGIQLNDLSEETLTRALNEVLINQKYRNVVKQRSTLMHDRPMTPVETAIYWVEHVIRHKGAPHLKSSGVDLKWYQREMIDVVVFLILVVSLILITILVIVKKLLQFVFSKSKKNVSNKKKSQ